MTRLDQPKAVMSYANRYKGGKALCVLGGPSAEHWYALEERLKPDVLITCNGAPVGDHIKPDFWVLGENMTRAANYAEHGKPRDQKFMKMFEAAQSAKVAMVNWRNFTQFSGQPSVMDRTPLSAPVVRIKRKGYAVEDIPKDYTLREYGDGFFYGGLFPLREAIGRRVIFHVGTVAMHLIHLAGILGCAEVHTIGLDLCFPDGRSGRHHWYDHPHYKPDKFRTEKMFTTWNGIDTQWDWMQAAEFIMQIEFLFKQDGLIWRDHSGGLLRAMGAWCAEGA